MVKNETRVALITMKDPRDRNAWSGTQYQIYQHLLKQYGEVEPLGPVKLNLLERGAIKLFEKLCTFMPGKYNRVHSLLRGYLHARHFTKRLRRDDYSFVFASACSPVVAFLRTDIPIVYLSDATFALVHNYYHEFSGLCRLSEFEGEYAERTAIKNASAVIVSSEWARKSVVEDYHASAGKVKVCLFGANIDEAPATEKSLKKLERLGRECNLLFLARDWRRKGGQVALEAFHDLRQRGFAVTLTICGCTPDVYEEADGLTVISFLDKSLDIDLRRYQTLMFQSHFLVLPTIADCTPMVFAEANAHGMPVITSDTGGIPSLIKSNVNGYLMPMGADGKAYADLIVEKYFDDSDQYAHLARSSRKKYDDILNWDAWGESVRTFIDHRSVAVAANDLSLQR